MTKLSGVCKRCVTGDVLDLVALIVDTRDVCPTSGYLMRIEKR